MKTFAQSHGKARLRLLTVVAAAIAITALAAAAPAGAAKTVFAKKLTRILPQGKEPVLFEGGSFGPEGNFFFANVLRPAGRPEGDQPRPEDEKVEDHPHR